MFADRAWPYGKNLACKIWTYDWTTRSGCLRDKTWRQANPGGWWSWDLKVHPAAPMALLCRYWADDTRPRNFDILVDDQVIATQNLGQEQGELLDIEYPIPVALTQGKQKITVKFRPRENSLAGPVYHCAATTLPQ